MFWTLLLAHFVGDFVLQTDWMVKKRDSFWVLASHAMIHFMIMFLLVGWVRSAIWPYLLMIAAWHFIQDRIKINVTKKRPASIALSFFVDQGVHMLVIWAVIGLYQEVSGEIAAAGKPAGVMIALAFVFVTFVWFITERIFNTSNSAYLMDINQTKYPRMLSRAGLVSVFLLFWHWTAAGLSLWVLNPYPRSKFRRRAVLTDGGVSLLAMIFLYWALS